MCKIGLEIGALGFTGGKGPGYRNANDPNKYFCDRNLTKIVPRTELFGRTIILARSQAVVRPNGSCYLVIMNRSST
jgi:hypothetical protein